MGIGGVLSKLLKSQNYPISQYCRDTGLSRSQIYKIFNNEHSPTFETMRKLTTPLNITICELITLIEDQKPG